MYKLFMRLHILHLVKKIIHKTWDSESSGK